jgi:hypothetical protein
VQDVLRVRALSLWYTGGMVITSVRHLWIKGTLNDGSTSTSMSSVSLLFGWLLWLVNSFGGMVLFMVDVGSIVLLSSYWVEIIVSSVKQRK